MKKILLIGLYGSTAFMALLIIAIILILPPYLAKETNNNNWLLLYLPILVLPMVVLLGTIAYNELNDSNN
jgi:hypothetical protein